MGGNGYELTAVKFFNGRYHMYFTAPNTLQGGPAIGVATSASPAGPWQDSGTPVVPPENNPYNNNPGCSAIDPDEVQDASGQRYLSYGSFNRGISVRKLSANGLTSDASSETQIAVNNYFEGSNFLSMTATTTSLRRSTITAMGPSVVTVCAWVAH